MAAALSMDLRKRIVQTYLSGGVSDSEVVEQFCVGKSTVGKLVRQFKRMECLQPKTHLCGRKLAIVGELKQKLVQHVCDFLDATAQEHRDALQLNFSAKTVWLTIRRLNDRFKKDRNLAVNNSAKT